MVEDHGSGVDGEGGSEEGVALRSPNPPRAIMYRIVPSPLWDAAWEAEWRNSRRRAVYASSARGLWAGVSGRRPSEVQLAVRSEGGEWRWTRLVSMFQRVEYLQVAVLSDSVAGRHCIEWRPCWMLLAVGQTGGKSPARKARELRRFAVQCFIVPQWPAASTAADTDTPLYAGVSEAWEGVPLSLSEEWHVEWSTADATHGRTPTSLALHAGGGAALLGMQDGSVLLLRGNLWRSGWLTKTWLSVASSSPIRAVALSRHDCGIATGEHGLVRLHWGGSSHRQSVGADGERATEANGRDAKAPTPRCTPVEERPVVAAVVVSTGAGCCAAPTSDSDMLEDGVLVYRVRRIHALVSLGCGFYATIPESGDEVCIRSVLQDTYTQVFTAADLFGTADDVSTTPTNVTNVNASDSLAERRGRPASPPTCAQVVPLGDGERVAVIAGEGGSNSITYLQRLPLTQAVAEAVHGAHFALAEGLAQAATPDSDECGQPASSLLASTIEQHARHLAESGDWSAAAARLADGIPRGVRACVAMSILAPQPGALHGFLRAWQTAHPSAEGALAAGWSRAALQPLYVALRSRALLDASGAVDEQCVRACYEAGAVDLALTLATESGQARAVLRMAAREAHGRAVRNSQDDKAAVTPSADDLGHPAALRAYVERELERLPPADAVALLRDGIRRFEPIDRLVGVVQRALHREHAATGDLPNGSLLQSSKVRASLLALLQPVADRPETVIALLQPLGDGLHRDAELQRFYFEALCRAQRSEALQQLLREWGTRVPPSAQRAEQERAFLELAELYALTPIMAQLYDMRGMYEALARLLLSTDQGDALLALCKQHGAAHPRLWSYALQHTLAAVVCGLHADECPVDRSTDADVAYDVYERLDHVLNAMREAQLLSATDVIELWIEVVRSAPANTAPGRLQRMRQCVEESLEHLLGDIHRQAVETLLPEDGDEPIR
ncbi:hypothetical protein CDCA_CDCA09G2711 [Cyanidium caldarium]|uniref:Uncharacterized protein n=1 Tax=Cyanidium caldarium TaxID=2771 RepID=A0AAV9IX39_CYACA|nr:hypothetical protein CDCA_CDCA09G2711 [Cyanidium caldarium]